MAVGAWRGKGSDGGKMQPIDYSLSPATIDRELRACAPGGKRLALLLSLRRTTAANLARYLNCSNAVPLRLMRGQQPTYREAVAIANLLRAPVDVLFGRQAASRHYLDNPIPEEWR